MSDGVVRATMHYLPARLAPAIAGIALVPVLGSSLSPADFGRYALVTASLAYVAALAGDWLISGYQRSAQTATPADIRVVVSALLLVSGGTAAGLIFVGAALDALVPAAVGAILVPYQLLRLQWVGLQMDHQAAKFSSLSVAYSLLKSAGIGAAAFLTNRLLPVVLAWVLITAAVLTAGPRLRPARVGELRTEAGRLRPIATVGVPLVLLSLALNLSATADRYIITALQGYDQAGVYAFGYLIAESLIALPASVPYLAAYPIAVRRFDAGDGVGAVSLMRLIVAVQVVLGAVVLAVVLPLAAPVVDVLGAPAYGEAARVLPGITAAQLPASVLSYYVLLFTLHRRPRAALLPFVVAGTSNIVMTTVLVAWLALPGAVLATVLTYALAVALLERAAPARLLTAPAVALMALALSFGSWVSLGGSAPLLVLPALLLAAAALTTPVLLRGLR